MSVYMSMGFNDKRIDMGKSTLKVGVIGHRDLGNNEKEAFIHFCCYRLLSELKQKYTKVIAISGISKGTDSIFAKSAISLGIELESIIPFNHFSSDFKDDLSLEIYRSLRFRSTYETRLSFFNRNSFAYKKSMDWLVFQSNVVIAVWDGREIGSKGGTWEAFSLSKKIERTLIHINAENKSLSCYLSINGGYIKYQNKSLEEIIKLL